MGPRREGRSASFAVSEEKHHWTSAPAEIIPERNRPRTASTAGGTTPETEVPMPDEFSSVGQRQGHPVSGPFDGEPEWASRARDLRQRGWTYKRVCAEVGHGHSAVHYWIAPSGGASKRNRRDYRTKTLNCAECGKEFQTSPSRLDAGRKYCSPACYYAKGRRSPEGTEAVRQKMRDQRKGRDNPFFKHGRYAGAKTKELEREFNLRKKGEHKCRNCGNDQGGMNAHHAVPRSLSPEGRLDLRNCLPLCISCHVKWHRGTPIKRDRFTEDEWSFVSTLIGDTWLEERYPAPAGKWEFRDPEREKTDEELFGEAA